MSQRSIDWRVRSNVIGILCTVALFGSAESRADEKSKAPQVLKSTPSQSDREANLAEAGRLETEIVQLARQNKYAEATEKARRLVAIYEALPDKKSPGYAKALGYLGRLWDLQNQLDRAELVFQQLADVHSATLGATSSEYAADLYKLANVFIKRRKMTEAVVKMKKAISIQEKVIVQSKLELEKQKEGKAKSKKTLGELELSHAILLNHLGEALQAQGEYRGARPLLEKALAIRKEVLGEKHPDYATSLNNLAMLLKEEGDYDRAKPLCEQALAIRKAALGEKNPAYATALNSLAMVLASQGDFAGAKPLYEQALAIRKEVLGEKHRDYATSLNNLAMLLEKQGDYAGAKPLYEQALTICKEVLGEKHAAYAALLSNLAKLLNDQGDYAGAKRNLEQTLAIRKKLFGEKHLDYARSLNNLATLQWGHGDYAGAKPLYEQALAILEEVLGKKHRDYATSLNNLALLLLDQGDYAAAKLLDEQALAIYKEVLGELHPDYAVGLNNLACMHWLDRDYPDAVALLERSLEICERNLGLAAAGQSERQQLAMTSHLRGTLDVYLSLLPVANVSASSAYNHVMAAKGAIFERQRKMRSRRRLLRADPESKAAKCFHEYEGIIIQLATLALAVPDPKQAHSWRENVAKLSIRADELESELAELNAGFRAAQNEARRTPGQLQASLPAGTALVDMLVYRSAKPPANRKDGFQTRAYVAAFLIRPDRAIERIDLGPLAPIQKAITDWRKILVAREATLGASDPALDLRRLIWEPLEPHLVGCDSVLVSPDGPIGTIPLAALPGKAKGSYLIEERSIALVPVPRALGSTETGVILGQRTNRAKADPAPSLLVAGDIDYGGDSGSSADRGSSRAAALGTRAGVLPNFARLFATGKEIASIERDFRKRFRGAGELELTGGAATEEAVRNEAPRHRFLHFATHGYFAPEDLRSALESRDPKSQQASSDFLGGAGIVGYHPGLLSGIVLAGANRHPTPIGQDDGILTALEVAELDLTGVDLAVLSACETGLGEVAGGEGLLGLQRAFQEAGAWSVLASLWQVDDEQTRALMSRFYNNLWQNNLPPIKALREAQLHMLKGDKVLKEDADRGFLRRKGEKTRESQSDRLPPYYWAAFVLSTDRP
jgi:CHAT domain-containing protein/tetratricopeptide (TPR) repeat protein